MMGCSPAEIAPEEVRLVPSSTERRGREVQELKELQRQGMSIQGISKLTGWDRKTIRKYFQQPSALPEDEPRGEQTSKRDDACRGMVRVRAVAGAARTELPRWIPHSERLAATADGAGLHCVRGQGGSFIGFKGREFSTGEMRNFHPAFTFGKKWVFLAVFWDH
jgi:hypothetical protein